MATSNTTMKQIIASEYKKCATDPVYFFSKYAYIQHPTRGKIKFLLFPFQKKVFSDMMNYRQNIILKSRQLGISTLSAGYATWLLLFQPDTNVLAIATKQETAKNIITKVRYMYKNLPSWLKIPVKEDNKLNLTLSNGSQVKAIAASDDAGRSEAVSVLIIDEAAFIDNIDIIWGGIFPTLSTGGRSIILSTPNGLGNFFHKQWVNAKDQGFNKIRLHWSMHPERDISWREEQESLLGKKLAAQECDADFISSGATVVDMEVLKYYKEEVIMDPVEKRGQGRNLWVWQHPVAGRSYMVCADASRGDGNDFSGCHVFDLETLEQVAEFKAKIDTKSYGNLLVALATEYNDALLIIENASIGWAVIDQVIERNYFNLFYMKQDLKYVDPNKQYSNKLRLNSKKEVAGFTTSVRTRPLIINRMEEYFRTQDVTIRSERTLDELYTFIWNGDKAEAMRGYNDDLILALSIGLWVRDTALQLNLKNIGSQKDTLSRFKVIKGEDSTFIPGKITSKQQWEFDIGNGIKEDMSEWLI